MFYIIRPRRAGLHQAGSSRHQIADSHDDDYSSFYRKEHSNVERRDGVDHERRFVRNDVSKSAAEDRRYERRPIDKPSQRERDSNRRHERDRSREGDWKRRHRSTETSPKERHSEKGSRQSEGDNLIWFCLVVSSTGFFSKNDIPGIAGSSWQDYIGLTRSILNHFVL